MLGVVQVAVPADEKRGAGLRGLDQDARVVVFIPVNLACFKSCSIAASRSASVMRLRSVRTSRTALEMAA
jgi:hypothetical protein